MSERTIQNAVIESTMLGQEDHGILTCFLMLNYGGSGQGFGGWALDEPRRDSADKFLGRFGTAWGMQFIAGVLKVLEVSSWEKLPGTHCRADADHGKVYRIGHILKDRWFDPNELEHP